MIEAIVALFRGLISTIFILGLVVIAFAGFALYSDEGGVVALAGVGLFAAGLVLAIGVAATLLQAVDHLKAIRDLLDARGKALPATPSVPSPPAAVSNLAPALDSHASALGGRKRVKVYKGHLIDKGRDNRFYVGDQAFPGVIAAEKYINSL